MVSMNMMVMTSSLCHLIVYPYTHPPALTHTYIPPSLSLSPSLYRGSISEDPLCDFMSRKLGWHFSYTQKLLKPIYNARNNPFFNQTRLLSLHGPSGRFAKVESKRVQHALLALRSGGATVSADHYIDIVNRSQPMGSEDGVNAVDVDVDVDVAGSENDDDDHGYGGSGDDDSDSDVYVGIDSEDDDDDDDGDDNDGNNDSGLTPGGVSAGRGRDTRKRSRVLDDDDDDDDEQPPPLESA